ncbi:unnamed protein product [Ophioblennius macclurei]
MDTTVAVFALCLLALAPLAQTGNETLTLTPPTITSPFDLTDTTTALTPANSTANEATPSATTEAMTQSANTSPTQATSSAESPTERTSSSQSSTTSPLVTNATASTQLSTSNVTTTEANQTTETYKSTSAASHSTHAVTTTSVPEIKTTRGSGLKLSERRLTIVFSVILGTCVAVVMIVLIFNKCKHKIQYLHQPLDNADNSDGFVADGDTLVISGGLYDGHPIYDNVPPPSADQSQFRLEFL